MREFSVDIMKPCFDGTYDSEISRTEIMQGETLEEVYYQARATLVRAEWVTEQCITDLGKGEDV